MSPELFNKGDDMDGKILPLHSPRTPTTTNTNNNGSYNNSNKKIATLCVGYCFSSAFLAIVNKWALMLFPFPSILTFLQYSSSAIAVTILGHFAVVERVRLDWQKARQFTPAVVLFYVSIFTNSKLLQHANVDTFIVFRSCCPLLVLPLEYLFLLKGNKSSSSSSSSNNNRNSNTSDDGEMMSTNNTKSGNASVERGETTLKPKLSSLVTIRQLVSLIAIFLGAIGFVLVDKKFKLHSYFWGVAYVVSMTVDMVLIKKIVTNVDLSTWGLVYYNNVLAMFLFPIAYFISGDYARYPEMIASLSDESNSAVLAISTSCLMGLSISYFGLGARRSVGATTFTVLGVVNKIGTVIINTVIWSHHASPMGLTFLMVCVFGGVVYQQEASKTKKSQRLLHKKRQFLQHQAGGSAAAQKM